MITKNHPETICKRQGVRPDERSVRREDTELLLSIRRIMT